MSGTENKSLIKNTILIFVFLLILKVIKQVFNLIKLHMYFILSFMDEIIIQFNHQHLQIISASVHLF